jgi:putative inorganic carbon (HCO3(-)) transporter
MRRAARVFDRAAFWLFAVLIIWAPIPLGSNRPWAWSLLEAGIFLVGVLWLLAYAGRAVELTPAMRRAWPALALFVLWLAWLAAQWITLPSSWVSALSPRAGELHALGGETVLATLSIDPHATAVFWLKSLAWALSFALVLLMVSTRRRLVWLCYVIVASGLIQAVYGSLMHLSGVNIVVLGTPIAHASQASGFYVNRNHLAGLLEMALAVGIGLMIAQLEDRGRRTWKQFVRDVAKVMLSRKAPLRILLVVMVIALVMTRSRMGNTAFFTSLLVAGAIALILSRHATRSTVLLIASLVVVDIFIVGAWFGVDKTIQRIEQTTAGDVRERVDPAIYAVKIVDDFPWFGTGGGTFYNAYPQYRGADILPYYDHVHNDYMQLATETGLPGFALLGAIVLLSFFAAVLAQSRRRDPLARGVAFGVVMGITALAIHSTVDFNLQIPANAFIFTVLLALGWLALYLERHENRQNRGQTPVDKSFETER